VLSELISDTDTRLIPPSYWGYVVELLRYGLDNLQFKHQQRKGLFLVSKTTTMSLGGHPASHSPPSSTKVKMTGVLSFFPSFFLSYFLILTSSTYSIWVQRITVAPQHTPHGRTPLDERSARSRGLYLTHNIHNKQTTVPHGRTRIRNLSGRRSTS
jgi:hypothetical protein